MKAELVAVKGRIQSRPIQFKDGDRLIIGRGEGCDIQILDVGLSRIQCEIRRQGESIIIKDLASRNGTWINGLRISEAVLKDGDTIKLGGLEFVFRSLQERRTGDADLITAVPEDSAMELKEKLNPDQTSLMHLPHDLQSLENYRRIQRDLFTIYRVGNLIHSENDPHKLRERIVEAIFDVISADRCVLVLDEGTPEQPLLNPVAHRVRSVKSNRKSYDASFSRTIAEESFRTGVSVLRSNVRDDEQFSMAESVIMQNIISVMCVPVESPDRILGVLYVDTVGHSEGFRKHDLELLAAVGRQAGIALRRMELQEELRESFFSTVRTLVATIEAKDDYTKGHSERVTNYAMQIGRKLELANDDIQVLELACLLHDVGKIGVMERLLTKPGPLTPEERQIMQHHPDIGARIINNIRQSETISDIVRHHHERWDGQGYPQNAKSEEIPITARILAVADTLDAMTSKRPYRDTPDMSQLRSTLQEEQGKQFDPKIAKVALEMLDSGELVIEAS